MLSAMKVHIGRYTRCCLKCSMKPVLSGRDRRGDRRVRHVVGHGEREG